MAITLLDMLLNAGLINRDQFEESLRNRVLYGGKIGTSLIELGYISEEELARFLSDKLSVPYVAPEKLLAIPQDIIDLLPAELALKYRFIPLSLEKKRLSLVMADPADLKAIDEIGFITGYIISPLITPEVRLIQALSKYYNAEMDPRYQHIIDLLETRELATAARQPSCPTLPPAAPPLPEAEPVRPSPAPAPPQEEIPAATVQPPPPFVLPPVHPVAPLQEPEPVKPPPPLEEEEELEEVEVVEQIPWSEKARDFEPDAVSTGLAYAESSEEIADLLIGDLGGTLKRVALFRIKNHTAICWKGVDRNEVIPGLEDLRLPLDKPSVLKTVTDSAGLYLGPLHETPINHLLNDALGGGHPQTVLVMPLLVWGRVVNVLYAEGDGDLSILVPDLQKLLTKAALAFEMLIFRDKILMM